MIYNWKSFPDDVITMCTPLPRPKGNRGGNKRTYLDAVAAFDIETTTVKDQFAVMYIWQLQIGLSCTIIGRSWKEYLNCLKRIRQLLPKDVWLVIYVHNLAFEFQFLRGIYRFKAGEIFAVDKRKPLRVDMFGCFEYRCSYLHSNMSLDVYLKKMGVQDQKVEGFDYSKARYPWTPLSEEELLYCVNDVRGLVEALLVEMKHDGDDLYSIPATSTGYVRRDVKSAMRKVNWYYIHDQLPDEEVYSLLREAFRGGNTHANRFYAGQILENVQSYDRSSSYPDVQINCEFPISRFRVIGECSMRKLQDLMGRRHKACLIRIALWDVRLRDDLWGAPYLAIDKCRRTIGGAEDNGRILSADYLETTLTDVDFRILLSEYEFSASKILCCAYARYGRLPQVLKDQIIFYYKSKTELKGINGQEIFYEKSKNKLNSIYGMSAQNPVKRSSVYVSAEVLQHREEENKKRKKEGKPPLRDWKKGTWEIDDEHELQELLDKSNKRAFFCYQWGVWTTSHARFRLEQGIRLAAAGAATGKSDFVYCDTDSVKYIGEVDWSEYNAERMADSLASGAWADDPKGKRHYMGVYEADDGYPATFATRGAKKYAVLHPDGKLEATISGVTKRSKGDQISGGEELAHHGGLSAFLQDEFVFVKAGGTALVYNDTERFMLKIDGHDIKVRECVTILPDTYTLRDTEDYMDLIKEAKIFHEFLLANRGKL